MTFFLGEIIVVRPCSMLFLCRRGRHALVGRLWGDKLKMTVAIVQKNILNTSGRYSTNVPEAGGSGRKHAGLTVDLNWRIELRRRAHIAFNRGMGRVRVRASYGRRVLARASSANSSQPHTTPGRSVRWTSRRRRDWREDDGCMDGESASGWREDEYAPASLSPCMSWMVVSSAGPELCSAWSFVL